MADPKERRTPLSFEAFKNISLYISGFENLSNFAQCSKLVYGTAKQRFWELDTQSRGKPALYQAIENNDHAAITEALDVYAKMGATGYLDGTGVDFRSFWWDDGRHAIKNVRSPVMLATEVGTPATLRLVVTHPAGCDINMRRVPQFSNAYLGHLDSCPLGPGNLPCSCWLHKECVQSSCIDERGVTERDLMACETAVHIAIRAQSTAKLRILLDAGAELVAAPRGRYVTVNLEDLVTESFRGTFAEGGMVHEDMMNIVEKFNRYYFK